MANGTDRNIRRLWLGQTTSLIGDWFLRIALPLLVLARTGSATATGLTFLSAYGPGLVLAPIAGALVEGWDHRRTMIRADVIRAGVVAVLLVQPSRREIWIVYVVAVAGSGVSQFFTPARTALIPSLVGAEHLAQVNGTMAIGSELALLAGPALGGLVYSAGGLRTAVVVDAMSYLVSATATSLLPNRSRKARRAGLPGSITALRSGLRLASRDPMLRSLFAANTAMALAAGIIGVAVVYFARRHLLASGAQYGTMLSAQAIGGLGGAWLSRRVSGVMTNKAWLLVTNSLVAAAVAGIAASGRWWVVALVLFGGGAPTTISNVVTTVLVQLTPPADFRARVASVYGWTSTAGLVLGTMAAGPLVTRYGSQSALVIAAGLMGASVVLLARLMPGPLRGFSPGPPGGGGPGPPGPRPLSGHGGGCSSPAGAAPCGPGRPRGHRPGRAAWLGPRPNQKGRPVQPHG